MSDAAIVVIDPRLDPNRMILEGMDVSAAPTFTVAEAAKVFFGVTGHWLRWKEREGFFVLDGKRVGTRRTPAGARVFDLHDIELVAHALAANGAITGEQLHHALVTVDSIARTWGYLPGLLVSAAEETNPNPD